MRRMAVGTPTYFKRRGRPRTPQDLERHELLTLTPHMLAAEHVFASGTEPVSVHLAGRVRLNNLEAIRELALAGVGIAILPKFLVGGDIRSGALRAVLRKHEPVPQDVNLVYPSKRYLPAKARIFMDFIAGKFRQVPELH